MRFWYNCARFPSGGKVLRTEINTAASRLFDKLTSLDVENLDVSEYNRRYFGRKLKNLKSALQLYSYILLWALRRSDVISDKFILLDYGGGSGMLSLLAKELGIGWFGPEDSNELFDLE